MNTLQAQYNMKYAGFYYTDVLDGIAGANTKAGYKQVQAYYGLKVDGIKGPDTDKMLLFKARILQYLLNLNIDDLKPIKEDGLIGAETIARIKVYQKRESLVDDGIAGLKTYKRLAITTHFKYFKITTDRLLYFCHCGKTNKTNIELIALLDILRKEFGRPFTITSGCRCSKCNKSSGGITSSRHLDGMAVDFYPGGSSLADIKRTALKKGAVYSYYGTVSMGNAIHINI